VKIVTLAYRTQGLILASGNPKGVKRISDVAKPNIRFVNRNPGSGTRLWLDSELRKIKIPVDQVNGYETVVKTHTEAAALIAADQADASLGLQAAARHYRLDFIPLFEERYDFVLPRENEHSLLPVLDYIQTRDFRDSLTVLTGYNTAHSGEQIPL
jgi:molybdate-binding protein